MSPSVDKCSVCGNPFFGRQKCILCAGNCGTRIHEKCANIDKHFTCVTCGDSTMFRSPSKKNQDKPILVITQDTASGSPAKTLKDMAVPQTLNTKLEELVLVLTSKVDHLVNQVADLKEENVLLRVLIESMKVASTTTHNCEKSIVTQKKSFSQALVSTSGQQNPGQQRASTNTDGSLQQSARKPNKTADNEGYIVTRYHRKTPNTTKQNAEHETPRTRAQLGVRNSDSLKTITKPLRRSKALFVSRFTPEVSVQEITNYVKNELNLEQLQVTKLRTKHASYSSFHVSVAEQDFERINNTVFWPSGCLICPFYGRLKPDQMFVDQTAQSDISVSTQESHQGHLLMTPTSEPSATAAGGAVNNAG